MNRHQYQDYALPSRLFLSLLLFTTLVFFGTTSSTHAQEPPAPTPTGSGTDEANDSESGEANEGESGEREEPPPSTADHSQFGLLQQDFATAQDVIAACQECHNQSADQLHASVHWNWEFQHPETGQLLGKRHILDNNVLAIDGNEAYCATCHNGYGMDDAANFDYRANEAVDCLSCHDTTGTYAKLPGAAGHPAYEATEYPPGSGNTWSPPDLSHIAQNVGPTSRASCGSCHFGERNVNPFIHGHLPAALEDAPEDLDVHIGTEFLDFSCSSCHTPHNHQFFSSKYQPVSESDQADSHLVHATCRNCHDRDDVHNNPVLTRHVDRLACQTCHIPRYARAGPQMVSWDWSQAGRTDDQGKPVVERNEDDLLRYHGHYGAFTWDENIRPEYVWFDGTITFTKIGDTIDPNETVSVNALQGSYDNPNARLWPVRVVRGVIPYDTEQNTLVAVNLYGEEQSAYWQTMNWDDAIQAAMQEREIPYSGRYDFVETEMTWVLNHAVAPADQAVRCGECHSRTGILSNVRGSYVPGRDRNLVLDVIGWVLVGGTLAGVLVHSSLRFVTHQQRTQKKGEQEG